MQASIVFLYRGLKHNACFIFQTPLFVFLCFIANKLGRSNKHLNGFILVLFVCLKKKILVLQLETVKPGRINV